MDIKSPINSKTIWFNLIAGIVQVFDQVGGWGTIPQPYGAALQSLINIGLRFITSGAVKF